MLQVRTLVDRLEKQQQPKIVPEFVENEVFRNNASSVQDDRETPKFPNTRHARSCLASGLFHAVYKGRLKKVQFLLDNGSNINAKNDYGYSVLVAALHIENKAKRNKMFRFLLENEADPLQRDPKYKRTALSWAAVLGRENEADILLDLFMGEFDFHEKDRDGMTALHLATQSGHTEVVRSLVREMTKYGTTVDVPDNLGLTPYLHARRLGYGLIADILVEEGGASKGQGDLYSFKKADEWREIGIRERNEHVKQRRMMQFEHAAIAGSARMLNEFEGPGYDIISIPVNNVKRRRDRLQAKSQSAVEHAKTAGKSVRLMAPRSSLNGTRIKNMLNNKYPSDNIDGRSFDPLALIQMREPPRGVAPKRFRSSTPADTDDDDIGNGGLATMMDYLALQYTKSFRRSVPPLKKEEEVNAANPKRSTLASIFGKDKKGRKSPATGSAKKKKSGSGKGRRTK